DQRLAGRGRDLLFGDVGAPPLRARLRFEDGGVRPGQVTGLLREEADRRLAALDPCGEKPGSGVVPHNFERDRLDAAVAYGRRGVEGGRQAGIDTVESRLISREGEDFEVGRDDDAEGAK